MLKLTFALVSCNYSVPIEKDFFDMIKYKKLKNTNSQHNKRKRCNPFYKVTPHRA